MFVCVLCGRHECTKQSSRLVLKEYDMNRGSAPFPTFRWVFEIPS